MSKKRIIAIAAASCTLFGVAMAHPGARLLTAGGTEGRSAMTPGMSYEDVSGVHIFRGKASAEKDYEPALDGRHDVDIEVTHRVLWRSIRSLRTQGFYSGRGAQSRRYTQGFYSGY